MIRAWLLLSLMFCIISAVFLFRIKHEVLDIERKIIATQRKIRQKSRENTALRSELSYLTRPQRIHALGRQFLPQWQTLRPQQVVKPDASMTRAPSP